MKETLRFRISGFLFSRRWIALVGRTVVVVGAEQLISVSHNVDKGFEVNLWFAVVMLEKLLKIGSINEYCGYTQWGEPPKHNERARPTSDPTLSFYLTCPQVRQGAYSRTVVSYICSIMIVKSLRQEFRDLFPNHVNQTVLGGYETQHLQSFHRTPPRGLQDEGSPA